MKKTDQDTKPQKETPVVDTRTGSGTNPGGSGAKVKALESFVGMVDGVKWRVQIGDVFPLPKGVDWLKAGLVEKV